MERKAVSAIMLTMLLIGISTLTFNISMPSARSETNAEILAPLASYPAVTDGFLSSGEYDDAFICSVGTPNDYGYLFIKHNNTVLWVLLDHVTDTKRSPLGWDNGWVGIDAKMDGGDIPKADDLLFHESGHNIFIGDGVNPFPSSLWGWLGGHTLETTQTEYVPLRDLIKPYYVGSGQAYGPTPTGDMGDANAKKDHIWCEMQIPLNWLNGSTTVGFAASMQDNDAKTIIDWPETHSDGAFWPGPDTPQGNYIAPNYWGKLTLISSTHPPPPPPRDETPYLYIGIAAVAVAVVASTIVLTMRRRKRTGPQLKGNADYRQIENKPLFLFFWTGCFS